MKVATRHSSAFIEMLRDLAERRPKDDFNRVWDAAFFRAFSDGNLRIDESAAAWVANVRVLGGSEPVGPVLPPPAWNPDDEYLGLRIWCPGQMPALTIMSIADAGYDLVSEITGKRRSLILDQCVVGSAIFKYKFQDVAFQVGTGVAVAIISSLLEYNAVSAKDPSVEFIHECAKLAEVGGPVVVTAYTKDGNVASCTITPERGDMTAKSLEASPQYVWRRTPDGILVIAKKD